MKRLPRGGDKVNYTVYIQSDVRTLIKERAGRLDMSEGFYLSSLVQADLANDLMAAPTINSENIETPATSPPVETEPVRKPPIQRPVMKSIDDLVKEQAGVAAGVDLAGTQFEPGWEDKVHRDLAAGEAGEAKFRREILEGLPPKKEVESE